MEQKTSRESKGISFFDLETTGTDVAKDRIVQIAVIRKDKDGTVDKKSVLINPEMPIPKEATEIHGITDEMVKDAPTFKMVAKSFMNQYIDGYDISGYNILGFDIPVLVEELLRAEVDFSFEETVFIDVMNIYHMLNPRTLSACYLHYTGQELDGAHDALVDTEATVKILEAMLQKEEEVKGKSNIELSELSKKNENIVDFAGKFVRNEAGVICYNFSKEKGKPVSGNLGMLTWMEGKDFTMDTMNWVRKLKKGEVI